MAGRDIGELMHANLSEIPSGTPFSFGNWASSMNLLEVPRRSLEDKSKTTDVRLSGVLVCKDLKVPPCFPRAPFFSAFA